MIRRVLNVAFSPLPPQWERGLGVSAERRANERSPSELNTRAA